MDFAEIGVDAIGSQTARHSSAPVKATTSKLLSTCPGQLSLLSSDSDVNKDWTCKDKDKDNDQAYKDQDKDKDLNLVLKESLRTRISLTVTYCKLQLNLQSLSSNNNEKK